MGFGDYKKYIVDSKCDKFAKKISHAYIIKGALKIFSKKLIYLFNNLLKEVWNITAELGVNDFIYL